MRSIEEMSRPAPARKAKGGGANGARRGNRRTGGGAGQPKVTKSAEAPAGPTLAGAPSYPLGVVFETLALNDRIAADLDTLVATGLFGITRSEVAEQLLREKLRELALQGWVRR